MIDCLKVCSWSVLWRLKLPLEIYLLNTIDLVDILRLLSERIITNLALDEFINS